MDLERLEHDIQKILDSLDEGLFIFDLLLAYGFPKATITRLKNGDRNQSKKPGEIIWKKNLCFTDRPDGDLFTCIDALRSDPAIKKHHPRFIVVTDYETFLAVDSKTEDTLDIPLTELPKRANFFLPWAGMEKSAITSENPADIKAAEKMGQLYDLLLQNNDIEDEDSRHALNVFLSRLLFCFFAEDTGIFEDDQFTKMVDSHTVEDGSNLQPLLERLFGALNEEDRSGYPDYLRAFPCVNGGLFADALPVPVFSRKARKMLIDCGALNWKAINPDIFGSMMQAVTLGEERSSIGMHYTSVVNIMKVIEPLFLNDLKEALEKADGHEKKLEKLLDRLYHIRIFDPACGSGNFLIIAYKELCRLEIEIFQQLQELNPGKWGIARSGIQLNQFFGIEIDDFAAETARLSLWLAEHQMNLEFVDVFGETRPTLPLSDSGNIVCGNATRLDWKQVCPKSKDKEFYIFGNPPYLGTSGQSKIQKEDMAAVFGKNKSDYHKLDYISCWFMKAARHSAPGNLFSFVSTNSICQGIQVEMLWPKIFELDLEIIFSYKSFHWSNSAKNRAGVTCSIIGVGNKKIKPKYLYEGGIKKEVGNINAYLIDAANIIIKKRTKSLSNLPRMLTGNNTYDGGHLMLSTQEKNILIDGYPESEQFVKRLLGSREFINGLDRWCLWINDDDLAIAINIPPIKERIDNVRRTRESAGGTARRCSHRPHQFEMTRRASDSQIILPKVSSERREYIPAGFLDRDTVVTCKAQVIYDSEPYIFGVISSHMHMTWIRAVSSRLRSDYQYQVGICYNTFPFPNLNNEQKSNIEEHVFKVLDVREQYSEKTIAELYDPHKMPDSLKHAHNEMDLAIEKCYRSRPFSNDEERLEYLFNQYEKMIEAEGK